MLDLANYLDEHEVRLTELLERRDWKPSRAHIEGNRNAFASAKNTLKQIARDTAPQQEEIVLKDARDHLKAGIAEMKGIGNEPPMSIYKAMHALTHALTEANERVHYAEGTAALAMKHRDEAEARLAEAQIALEAPTKEEIMLRAQLAEARKALERINSDEKNCTDYCRRQAKAALSGESEQIIDQKAVLQSQIAEVRKALSNAAFQARQWIKNAKGPRDRGIAIAFESFCKEQHAALSGENGNETD